MSDYIEAIKEAGYEASWFKDPKNWKAELRKHETVCRQIEAGRYRAINTSNLITELAQSHQIKALQLITDVRTSPNSDRKEFITSKAWCSKAGLYHNLSELDYLERSGFFERSKPDAVYYWQTWEA